MNETNVISYITPLLILGATVFSIFISLSPRALESLNEKGQSFSGKNSKIGKEQFVKRMYFVTVCCLILSKVIAGLLFISTVCSVVTKTQFSIVFIACALTVSYLFLFSALMSGFTMHHSYMQRIAARNLPRELESKSKA